MKTRDTVLMSICVGLLLFEVISPINIPFLSMIVFGFMLNFLSFRKVLQAILTWSLFGALEGGLQYGVFGFVWFALVYICGALVLMPFGYFTFKKYKVRERLGK